MNKIKIFVSFERNEIIFPKIELVENDYNHVEFEFSFDDQKGKNVFELKKPNGKVFIKEIIDNKVILSDVDDEGKSIPIINRAGIYEFEVTKYTEDSKFTINKICHFVARDELVNVDDDTIDNDIRLPILDDLINSTIFVKKNTEEIAKEAEKQGNYAKSQGDYAKNQGTFAEEKNKKIIAAEEIRLSNENIRIKNEEARKKQEETRIANEKERTSNEKIRVANEDIRSKSEESRQEYITQLKQDVADGKFNGECNFATFNINLETGNLEMNKTEDLLLDFAIEDGKLEVLI